MGWNAAPSGKKSWGEQPRSLSLVPAQTLEGRMPKWVATLARTACSGLHRIRFECQALRRLAPAGARGLASANIHSPREGYARGSVVGSSYALVGALAPGEADKRANAGTGTGFLSLNTGCDRLHACSGVCQNVARETGGCASCLAGERPGEFGARTASIRSRTGARSGGSRSCPLPSRK